MIHENDNVRKLVNEIKAMDTYKEILKDSFGGIMFNRANKNKYKKDINLKFIELENICSDIWYCTDGIFRGIWSFVMKD